MAVKYRCIALGVVDGDGGKKVIHFRMKCGTPVEVECDPNQADFIIRQMEDSLGTTAADGVVDSR